MGRSKSTDSGEIDFTRAATDELRDAERQYQVVFDILIEPTPQRGVWTLVLLARAKGEHDRVAYSNRYTNTWPSATAVSFGAFLYQCCHRMVRMVEAWHTQRETDESKRA